MSRPIVRQIGAGVLCAAAVALAGAGVHAQRVARSSVNRGASVNRSANVNRSADVNRSANVNRSADINRSANVNRDVNVNRNVDVNRNLNVGRDVDVNVDHRYGGGGYGCCYHPAATAAAVTAAAVTTAAVVGSAVNSLPPSCQAVSVNGFTYQQCGSTWYQPQFAGSNVTYIVVNPPR
jgi:UDP-3-O-[3-hydroxymyristoyl] glucosamine N-acyltransferase